jgi:hypothetical protein
MRIYEDLRGQMHMTRSSYHYFQFREFARPDKDPSDLLKHTCSLVPKSIKAQMMFWYRTHSMSFDRYLSYGGEYVEEAVESFERLILEEWRVPLGQVFFQYYVNEMHFYTTIPLEQCAIELTHPIDPVSSYNALYEENYSQLRIDLLKSRLELGV